MAARGLWIYAITERVTEAGLRQLTGVGGEPVRAVRAARLVAVAEDVGLAEFGEEALRRNLEDMDWLEATARAHHRVIDAVAQQGPVVPMRLATVYRGEASVAAMLSERSGDFRAALERITGRQEWGVKAHMARPAEPAEASSAARPARAGAGAGAAYLQRRRDELTAQRRTRRDALASAEVIHAELSRHAAAARLHPPQAPQLTGNTAPMILNAAYLLDEESGADFAAAVTDLAGQYPAVRLELTGPWPPYSFAGLEEVQS